MEYSGREARICAENIESSLAFDKKIDDSFETVLAALKEMGLGNLVKDAETLKKNWEEGLKESHKKTREFYEKAEESFRETYKRFGIEEA